MTFAVYSLYGDCHYYWANINSILTVVIVCACVCVCHLSSLPHCYCIEMTYCIHHQCKKAFKSGRRGLTGLICMAKLISMTLVLMPMVYTEMFEGTEMEKKQWLTT